MAALVVHASKDDQSTRALFTSPVLWQVHVVDADGRVFHPDTFDHLLRFPPKLATK
jgi:hypothetical protein